MKEKMIEAVIRQPIFPFVPMRMRNTLKDLQKLVGGYIEPIRLCKDVVAIVDEEGKLKYKDANIVIGSGLNRDTLVGTVLFVGIDGEEFASCPYTALEIHDLIYKHWTELPDPERTGRDFLDGGDAE